MDAAVDELRDTLKKITESETFRRSKRSRQLLTYVVEETLQGRDEGLKAFSIALDVFGKDASFDTVNDPLVRVQIGRLRALLADYYAAEGAADAIRIEIAKGAYRPRFPRMAESAPAATAPAPPPDDSPDPAEEEEPDAVPAPAPEEPPLAASLAASLAAAPRFAREKFIVLGLLFALGGVLGVAYKVDPARLRWPSGVFRLDRPLDELSVAAPPLVALSRDDAGRRLGERLSPFVLAALSKVNSLAIIADIGDGRADSQAARARFIFEGKIASEARRATIAVSLLDRRSSAYVWIKSYDADIDAAGEALLQLSDRIASEFYLAIHRAASTDDEAKLASATPKELYLAATFVPSRAKNSLQWERQRVELARRAIAIDPLFGPAHSVLADKLAFLADIDPPSDTEALRAEAARHADRAIDLAPEDADVAFNVGMHYWHAGNSREAERFLQRATELNPHHPIARFFIEMMPYGCAIAPESVIERLKAQDQQMPADSPARWVTFSRLSAFYLNQGDFVRAVDYGRRAIAIFHQPDAVIRLAVALVRIGDVAGARDLLKGQLENWPNLDLMRYAEVSVPRRCDGASRTEYLRDLYTEMAKAVGPLTGGGAR